jgi:CubicO group peptidase (beta-lactamase class C family)
MEESLRQSVDECVASYVSAKVNVGLTVGVVRDGQEHAFFYGRTRKDGPLPDDDTLFEIGSITKVFTATLLAEMSLKGEVGLDDPVNRYLPEPVRLASRGGMEVTLRHLATHTSGLPRLPGNLGWKALFSSNPYAHYTVDDLYRCLRSCRLRSKPGTEYLYSNLGAGLLGHVLGLAAGAAYEELVLRRICRPLGMDDMAITLSPDQQQRLAQGHAGGEPAPPWDHPTLPGAGALRSSTRDMLRFLHANMAPQTTSLAEALVLAQTLQIEETYRIYQDPGCMAGLTFLGLAALFATSSFGLPPWLRIVICLIGPLLVFRNTRTGLRPMALGWHIHPLPGHPQRVLEHNGGTGGYASYLGFVNEAGVGVVLLSNSDNVPDPAGVRILQKLAGAAT